MVSLIHYDEFGKGMGLQSIVDSFQSEKYEGQNEIIEYLRKGNVTMVSADFPIDFISGKQLDFENTFMNDGKFSWTSLLVYYVENYNLRLPKVFEDYVLKKK